MLSSSYGYDTRYDAFYLRGFPAYYTGIFRDGLRQVNGPSGWFRNDPYTTEGVAILKGPASSLYGVSGPGGLVNIVTKRPKDEPFREIEALAGTDDRRQLAFDVTGPADGEERLLYRLTGLWRESDTHLAGYPDDKALIAPALTWNIGPDTSLTLLTEWSEATTGGTAAFFNPAYGTASRIYGGDPAWNDFRQKQVRLGAEFEHRFSDSLVFRQNLRWSDVEADLKYSGLYADGPGLARYWGHYTEQVENLTFDTMLELEFATGAVAHELLVGLDWTKADYDAFSGLSYVSAAEMAASPLPYAGGQESRQLGLYLHDQMSFGGWTLLASARLDRVETLSIDKGGAETEQTDRAASGRIGLSYEMANGLVPYANLSTSFSPNIGLVHDDVTLDEGRVADPTRALQREIGVKYRLPGTNSLLSAALFDIDQRDGIVFDTSTGMNRQRQLDLNSRGIELEAATGFDNGLSVIASYTHLRVKIEEGLAGTVGNELSATPNDVAALWVHYAPPEGPLAGWGFGAGLRYVGESHGDDANSFRNDDRAFVDAALSYDFADSGLQLQVNVKNLFDQEKQMCTAGYCYFDEGRSATASLRYRF